MASQLTPTTLGGLEFEQIKESLTNYLKTQSLFDGYNFEGSAMQTVIDMLAYNTFYYAYYANMINAEAFLDSAQKTSSVISLCKPLGFTVPDRTSARAIIQISSNTDGKIDAGTLFQARNSDGDIFNFYNLDDYDVVNGQSEEFEIVQGDSYIEIDAASTFDFTNQKISIAQENFDLSTLKITITEVNDAGITETNVWTKLQNVGYTSQTTENIYFIERTSTGFSILFGSQNSLGREITTKAKSIKIRYLTSSGSSANSLSLFTSSRGTVTTKSDASDGRNAPDLDSVRFVAPKWFASQERAVTVNDYKALLLESGFYANQNEFNVFGGQDLTPPKYGRVFVTSDKDTDDPDVLKIISFLKERSVITVFPEYVSSNDINVFVDFSYRLGNSSTNTASNKIRVTNYLKSLFSNNFSQSKKYSVEFSSTNFIDYTKLVNDNDVKNLILSAEDFNIYFKQTITPVSNDQGFVFNLNNEFNLENGVYADISEPFTSSDYGSNCILKMYVLTTQQKSNITKLQLWQRTTSGDVLKSSDVGYFIATKGVLSINPNIIQTGTSATLVIDFLRKNVIFDLNNKTTLLANNITAL